MAPIFEMNLHLEALNTHIRLIEQAITKGSIDGNEKTLAKKLRELKEKRDKYTERDKDAKNYSKKNPDFTPLSKIQNDKIDKLLTESRIVLCNTCDPKTVTAIFQSEKNELMHNVTKIQDVHKNDEGLKNLTELGDKLDKKAVNAQAGELTDMVDELSQLSQGVCTLQAEAFEKNVMNYRQNVLEIRLYCDTLKNQKNLPQLSVQIKYLEDYIEDLKSGKSGLVSVQKKIGESLESIKSLIRPADFARIQREYYIAYGTALVDYFKQIQAALYCSSYNSTNKRADEIRSHIHSDTFTETHRTLYENKDALESIVINLGINPRSLEQIQPLLKQMKTQVREYRMAAIDYLEKGKNELQAGANAKTQTSNRFSFMFWQKPKEKEKEKQYDKLDDNNNNNNNNTNEM